jgi:glycosyltransferase involved in cell wall biosynthesis
MVPDLIRADGALSKPHDSTGARPELTIGILHLGSPVHGINRYGRIIATELRKFAGVSVVEHHHDLTRPGWRGVRDAARVIRSFGGVDVVIVPYCTNGLWGSQRAKLAQLCTVLIGVRSPVVTVLHDVYGPRGQSRSELLALAMCVALPRAIVIHGEHERARLEGLPRAERARVIPHFIEQRHPVARDEARRTLGVDPDARIVGVLGWIHPRKHYEVAVRLLAALEPGFQLWLIGAPSESNRNYLATLQQLARELGVAERIAVTGYVDDDELELRIAALDVGLCPYRDASASGSMSTLLSARRSIVASDFALATELAELAPEAITLVADADMAAYRDAVVRAAGTEAPASAFDAVLQQRSPDTIAAQYLDTLRAVTA